MLFVLASFVLLVVVLLWLSRRRPSLTRLAIATAIAAAYYVASIIAGTAAYVKPVGVAYMNTTILVPALFTTVDELGNTVTATRTLTFFGTVFTTVYTTDAQGRFIAEVATLFFLLMALIILGYAFVAALRRVL
jgi:hypothetical protein